MRRGLLRLAAHEAKCPVVARDSLRRVVAAQQVQFLGAWVGTQEVVDMERASDVAVMSPK